MRRSDRRSRTLAAWMAVGIMATTGGCGGDREPPDDGYVPLRHPFRGATLLVDDDSLAAHWQRRHRARWLDPITRTPQARWLTGDGDLTDLPEVMAAARRRKALLVLVVYDIPNLDCAGPGAGAADATAYAAFVGRILKTLGDTRAAVVLEPDAVASDCFDEARAAMLTDAARRLHGAGHDVYLDAGHHRWRGPEETAERLRAAGIRYAEGFAVNVSNRQSVEESHRWGVAVSRLVGDREMVIDTSRNGLPAPPDDQWCNSAWQGLGRQPTTDPGLDRVAALLWVKSPGESDGPCGVDPGEALFSPRQARRLVMNAPWVPEAIRRLAADADPPAK